MKVYIVFGTNGIYYPLVLLGIYPTLDLAMNRIDLEIDKFDDLFYEVVETGPNGADCNFELDV